MKRLFYQYWDGVPTPECEASVKAMKEYCDHIGAEHLFEVSPKYVTNLGKYSPHYGQFKVVFEEQFDEYDQIVFTDTDVFPVQDLEENVFDALEPEYDLGIVEEWQQVEVRKKHTVAGINHDNDLRWAEVVENRWDVKMPRSSCGSVRAYNSGVVVWNRSGLDKAAKNFVPFIEYVSMIRSSGLPAFYTCDQPYLHAMLEVAELNWKSMDYKWNSSVHYVPGTSGRRPVNDLRNDEANFVHVQLAGATNFDEERLQRVVNMPVWAWGF